ncbi:MAG: protease modulator HflC [Pseudomonadota bacterium]
MTRIIAIPLLILLAIGSVVLFNTFYTVNPAQQAIVLQFGQIKDVEEKPGLKWKIPFIQQVIYLEKRVLDLDIPSEEVVAADQKRYLVNAFVRYQIDNPLRFYQSVGNEFGLQPKLAELLESKMREVLGRQTFETLLSEERAALMLEIRDAVNGTAENFGIDVVDVRILRVDLPTQNSDAIFERMRTARQREASELRAQGREEAERIRADADREKAVLLAEARRDSEIIRGEGDAERNRIFAEAFNRDPEFFDFYRTMQAYRASLADPDTTLVLSPDSDFFRFFSEDQGSR